MAAKKKPKIKRKRTAVPHTHLSLAGLGAFKESLPQAKGHEPNADYRGTYRILFADGYTPLKAQSLGFLHLARRAGKGNKTFALQVNRCMQNPDDQLHHLRMQVVCRQDTLATPLAGSLASRYTTADGAVVPELSQDERFVLKGTVLEYHHGKSACQEKSVGSHAHTWGLFEAVTRLPFKVAKAYAFSLLDGTDVLKPAHEISYVGSETVSGPGSGRIHTFAQVGSGIIPTEYSLDDAHRLLSVVTSARVYVREELMPRPMARSVKAAFDRIKQSTRRDRP